MSNTSPIGNDTVPPDLQLRDYFAAAAIQGLLAREAGRTPQPVPNYEKMMAEFAYRIADAMMTAR